MLSLDNLPKGVIAIGPPIAICNRCNIRQAVKAEKLSNPNLEWDHERNIYKDITKTIEYWVNTCEECETKLG